MTEENEVPEEVKMIIEKGIEVVEMLRDINDPKIMSKILAVAITHVLCHRVANEEHAHAMLDMLMDDIDSAVITTKKFGVTSWVEGTSH